MLGDRPCLKNVIIHSFDDLNSLSDDVEVLVIGDSCLNKVDDDDDENDMIDDENDTNDDESDTNDDDESDMNDTNDDERGLECDDDYDDYLNEIDFSRFTNVRVIDIGCKSLMIVNTVIISSIVIEY